MLIGLGVFLFIATWRGKPVGDLPVASGPVQDRTGARLGNEDSSAAGPATEQGPAAEDDAEIRGAKDAYYPGVHAQYFDAVRDNTVFRAEESDAWFHLLQVLEQSTDQRLAESSGGPVGYLQLDRQPLAYRGRLVTVSGTVRSAEEVAAPTNSYGIERYYQVWLQPMRSDPELIVLYVLHLPVDFPVGPELDEPASATGFFFKRWAYPSRSGILTAPLVLARTLDWQPAPPTPVTGSSQEKAIFAVVVASVFALSFVTWVWRRSQRPRVTSEAAGAVKLDAHLLGEAIEQRPQAKEEV
jgi:hypothetical protein